MSHSPESAAQPPSSAGVDGSDAVWSVVQRPDVQALQRAWRRAEPFPHICIEGLLEPGFAAEVANAYPSYGEARAVGRQFSALNENLKVQVCEPEHFPGPVARLHDALAAPAWLEVLSEITGIPRLRSDSELVGGGMHIMGGGGGRLDVHVDFNLIEDRALHRRLNILVFLNESWDEAWGGLLELWDADVRERAAVFAPVLNRCIIFETSEISYHGVTPLKAAGERVRKSFAAYYYTREPPAGWKGERHTTRFRARPDERLRGRVLMPVEWAMRRVRPTLRRIARTLRGR